MPELPDVVVYLERLATFTLGEPLERIRLLREDWSRSIEESE